MLRRLVLGYSGVGQEIVRTASSWPGELRVIDDSESRVESLRDRNVLAVAGDPADPDTYPEETDVVIVVGSTAAVNRAVAETAREAFPDALLICYTGEGTAAASDKPRIRDLADEVIDSRDSLADHVVRLTTGETADRTHRLVRVLRGIEGPLAVVTHDNPDPDAIASAIGLCRIAATVGLDAEACYFGEISHQKNRALVNLLDLDLRHLDDPGAIEEFGAVALVDHSRPGVNDQLPEETPIDVVIDHHPPRAPVEARFVDLRSQVGATSTLISEHLDRLELTVESAVATALLYGIQVDTKKYTREISESDFTAAATLMPQADVSVLEKVESPSVTAEVLDLIARSIRDRTVSGSALTACVGRITDRDALAQAAERLLDMEEIRTTLVYGFMDGTIYLSGRTRGSSIDLGETLRDAFDRIGSAGGHADMAGAQIPLGILGDVEDEAAESLTPIIREVIDDRFFEVLRGAPSVPTDHEGLTYEFPTSERAAVEAPIADVVGSVDGATDDDSGAEENPSDGDLATEDPSDDDSPTEDSPDDSATDENPSDGDPATED